jgi:hypothetical protein
MICVARACRGASGSVTAITTAKAAPSAPDENHLCPSITHSSPSRTAACAAASDRSPRPRLGHREERADLAGDERASQRSFCSSVPNSQRISALPASGAWQPKMYCAHVERPDLLVEVGVGEEAGAGAACLRREVRRPQSFGLRALR